MQKAGDIISVLHVTVLSIDNKNLRDIAATDTPMATSY